MKGRGVSIVNTKTTPQTFRIFCKPHLAHLLYTYTSFILVYVIKQRSLFKPGHKSTYLVKGPNSFRSVLHTLTVDLFRTFCAAFIQGDPMYPQEYVQTFFTKIELTALQVASYLRPSTPIRFDWKKKDINPVCPIGTA